MLYQLYSNIIRVTASRSWFFLLDNYCWSCLDLATDSYWIYTYVRNILSLFSKLFPGTLTICMALHGNPNFMKKTKLIFEFISNLVVLVSTVFILALFFFSFMLFPPRLFSTPIFENLHMGRSPKTGKILDSRSLSLATPSFYYPPIDFFKSVVQECT